MAELDNTLQGMQLGPGAPTSQQAPERPEDAAFRRLTEMVEQGQLKLTEDARNLLGMEREAIQAEPVPQAPGALQTFGAALSGIMGSQNTGNPQIAQSVLGALENRRRGAEAGAAEKVGRLRDLRQKELASEIAAAEDAQDTKLALAKAKELDRLDQDRKKEEQTRAEKAEKEKLKTQHDYRMDEIGAAASGRISLAERNAELKALQSDYGVPKVVAQAMQDARKGISANTRAYIAAAGGMGQVDPEELARLQASERIQHERSDQAIMARYNAGEFGAVAPAAAPKAGTPVAAAPAAGAGKPKTAAEELAEHQARMRASVSGGK